MKDLKKNVGSFATAKLQAISRRLCARPLVCIALVAVVGFTMAACGGGGGGGKRLVSNDTRDPVTYIGVRYQNRLAQVMREHSIAYLFPRSENLN